MLAVEQVQILYVHLHGVGSSWVGWGGKIYRTSASLFEGGGPRSGGGSPLQNKTRNYVVFSRGCECEKETSGAVRVPTIRNAVQIVKPCKRLPPGAALRSAPVLPLRGRLWYQERLSSSHAPGGWQSSPAGGATAPVGLGVGARHDGRAHGSSRFTAPALSPFS